jgi:hypothetical protein
VRGTHATLERALNRFPKTKPLDLVDVAYWSWQDLNGGGGLASSTREIGDSSDEMGFSPSASSSDMSFGSF